MYRKSGFQLSSFLLRAPAWDSPSHIFWCHFRLMSFHTLKSFHHITYFHLLHLKKVFTSKPKFSNYSTARVFPTLLLCVATLLFPEICLPSNQYSKIFPRSYMTSQKPKSMQKHRFFIKKRWTSPVIFIQGHASCLIALNLSFISLWIITALIAFL